MTTLRLAEPLECDSAGLAAACTGATYGGVHVSVQYANGAGIAPAKCWRNDSPRRDDPHYTSVIRTTKLGITAGGLLPENMTEERQEHVLEADSTEECDAWDVWVAELETVRLDPPPAKRLTQVSDIAETIVKTLLPDDEDDCREMINEDYQLKSDIDTFEHFTGKVIQPADDDPILGDELEMEDIERSL